MDYYKQICRHPLLSAEEELQLAGELSTIRLHAWDRIFSYPPYTRGLAEKLCELKDLKDDMIEKIWAMCDAADALRRRSFTSHKIEFRTRRQDVATHAVQIDPGLSHVVVLLDVAKNPRRHGLIRHSSQVIKEYIDDVDLALRKYQRVKDRFVRANLRLVISTAKTYASLQLIPIDDLIQEGNIGLMTAVDRYDATRGFRFSTYATWWIRHAINRHMANHGRTVRLPAHLVTAISKIRRVQREMEVEGLEATPEAISEITTVPVKKVMQVLRLKDAHPISMEFDIGEDRTLRDIMPDKTEPFDDLLFVKEQHDLLEECIADLPGIEGPVVRARYGLDGDEKTLSDLGHEFHLSRERIRQIQNAGLERLRDWLDED